MFVPGKLVRTGLVVDKSLIVGKSAQRLILFLVRIALVGSLGVLSPLLLAYYSVRLNSCW